jgi:hypothetical protein
VDADGDLVPPGGDPVDDAVSGEDLDEVVEGGEEGALLELGVVLVVELLTVHGGALGCELFVGDVAEGDGAREEPLGEGLVHNGGMVREAGMM